MHVHILGICGTFMGGVAALAQSAGHRVTGSDRNVYPPMSTQLEALGIGLVEGFDPAQLLPRPDVVVVGNVMSRGNPLVEAVLEHGLPYVSGPEWLAEHVLRGRWVIAVAGTHGKTTTTSMVAWILEHAGLEPGFLVGGIPANFGVSARLGTGHHFVVEADEYDTAFFDKRAKFVHYRPRTAILNNLEYDHADIYPDVEAIERQFHHLVRTVPGHGRLLVNRGAPHLARVLAMGAWTPVTAFGAASVPAAVNVADEWQVRAVTPDWSVFDIVQSGEVRGTVHWNAEAAIIGAHNAENALAALLAAQHAGVPLAAGIAALAAFRGVKRRMEVRGCVRGVTVYDDFAHHPTAIATTVEGLRQRVGAARILAVLEPRSNTMRLGTHREHLAASLKGADAVYFYQPAGLDWDLGPVCTGLQGRGSVAGDIDELVHTLAAAAKAGDHVLIMSNGGFGGLHGKLLQALAP
jgi:UDP-N-acetylmuramate: L-alanyl-gamma-D-glutamyl-meso-diaminopimelate ligase